MQQSKVIQKALTQKQLTLFSNHTSIISIHQKKQNFVKELFMIFWMLGRKGQKQQENGETPIHDFQPLSFCGGMQRKLIMAFSN